MDKIPERCCDTKSYKIIVLQPVTTGRQNLLFLQQYPTGAPDVWFSSPGDCSATGASVSIF